MSAPDRITNSGMKTTRRYGLAAIVKLTSFLSFLSPLSIETRAAIKDMQVKFGMPADSWPTPDLPARLRGG